jgi:hypothetical protein
MSGDWVEVQRWANDELAAKRALLELPNATHDESMVLRGEIKVLKNLLAQEDLSAPVPVGGGHTYD